MKNFLIVIRDLGLEMEAVYFAETSEEAEAKARDEYSVDLDCSPEDVEIIAIDEIGVCPKCNKIYKERPAISRRDNMTEICPNCGISEALEDFYNNIKVNGGLNA